MVLASQSQQAQRTGTAKSISGLRYIQQRTPEIKGGLTHAPQSSSAQAPSCNGVYARSYGVHRNFENDERAVSAVTESDIHPERDIVP